MNNPDGIAITVGMEEGRKCQQVTHLLSLYYGEAEIKCKQERRWMESQISHWKWLPYIAAIGSMQCFHYKTIHSFSNNNAMNQRDTNICQGGVAK